MTTNYYLTRVARGVPRTALATEYLVRVSAFVTEDAYVVALQVTCTLITYLYARHMTGFTHSKLIDTRVATKLFGLMPRILLLRPLHTAYCINDGHHEDEEMMLLPLSADTAHAGNLE